MIGPHGDKPEMGVWSSQFLTSEITELLELEKRGDIPRLSDGLRRMTKYLNTHTAMPIQRDVMNRERAKALVDDCLGSLMGLKPVTGKLKTLAKIMEINPYEKQGE